MMGVGQGHPLPRPVRAVYGPPCGPAWLREPHRPGSPARAPAAAAATVRHRAHANRSEAGQRQEPHRRASRGCGRPAGGRAWAQPGDSGGRHAAHALPPACTHSDHSCPVRPTTGDGKRAAPRAG